MRLLGLNKLLGQVALAVVAGLLIPTVVAGTAQADAFRYWGYYQWSAGEWAFATTGPGDTVPEDGAVEGWRFAVADDSSSRFPRTGDVFDDICGDASAGDGQKRVAVVIDYGTPEDAPEGDEPPAPRGGCAVVDEEATGADVLASVSEVRTGDDGLTCGIDGFPGAGCGDRVDGAAPTGEEQTVDLALPSDGDDAADDGEPETTDDGDGNQQIALIVGLGAVVLVGVAALIRMRR